MGWKNLKEAFNITHHVQVTEKGICIGSGYASGIVTIDSKTGELTESETFSGFLRQYYPKLREASPEELLKLIEAPDTFATAIPVFTYEGGQILEKQCETTGWPNVTHDGCMMFENMYSTDKIKVIAWAKHNAESAVSSMRDQIARIEKELAAAKSALAAYQDNRIELEKTYPSGESGKQLVEEYKFRKDYPTLAKMVDMLREKHNISDTQVFKKVRPSGSDRYEFGEVERYCANKSEWDLEALCFGEEGCSDRRGVDVYYDDDAVLGVPHDVYPIIKKIQKIVANHTKE
jgi:hypothetical protein